MYDIVTDNYVGWYDGLYKQSIFREFVNMFVLSNSKRLKSIFKKFQRYV